MILRSNLARSATLAAGILCLMSGPWSPSRASELASKENGVIKVQSGFPVRQTLQRLKDDIAAKGITMFGAVDQAALAAERGIRLRPSILLMFGNPALGARFVELNPAAGLDWPVRVLVSQDEDGKVWIAYTDFAYIARRHGIRADDPSFATAARVIASIAASVAAK